MSRIRHLLLALLCSFVVASATAEARAGGGGRGRGKDGYITTVLATIWWAIHMIRRRRMIAKAALELEAARKRDRSWDEHELKSVVKTTFRAYQEAWSKKDLESVRHLLHVDYYTEARATMRVDLAGKINVCKDPLVLEMNVMSIRDVDGQSGDVFVMEIDAIMIDYTVRESDGAFVESTLKRKDYELKSSYAKRAMTERSEFTEYWVFMRVGMAWRLLDIKESSAIVADLQGMDQTRLMETLARERHSKTANDDMFYAKPKVERKQA